MREVVFENITRNTIQNETVLIFWRAFFINLKYYKMNLDDY